MPQQDGSIDPWYADAGYPPVEACSDFVRVPLSTQLSRGFKLRRGCDALNTEEREGITSKNRRGPLHMVFANIFALPSTA